MCFCQLHPRFVADATEKMKEATYVCSPQLYKQIFTMFPIAGFFSSAPSSSPCPACIWISLRCSAACALELKTRLDWWLNAMVQVASSFFFDIYIYRRFWEKCLDFPCLNCDLYLWFLCPGIPFWWYRIQCSILSWSITRYLIYWPKNVGTLSYIIWIVYARLGVLGRNAKKYEKKDDGSQPSQSEKPATKERKRRKRPAETEAEEPEPKKSKGNKVKKSKAS